MEIPKILILFTLGATVSFAFPEHASLRGRAVFPDDVRTPSLHLKHNFEKSEKESNEIKDYEVCQTPECKKVAEEFISSINKSVNPCDNFYEFACSGWNSRNPIPPSLPVWSRFKMFQNTVNHRIKGILETEPEPSDILPVRQAKKWYRSCMDTEAREERGMKPIESILLRAGGWPIIMDEDEWDADEYSWKEVERSYARLTGTYTFYDIFARPSYRKGDTYGQIMIAPQDLPLSEQLALKYRNYSGNDYELYVRLVTGIAAEFVDLNQADVSEEKILQDARDIVEFEKEIYKLRAIARSDDTTLQNFIDYFDNNVTESYDPQDKIDWHSVIQGLFDSVNIKVNLATEIHVTRVPYFEGIADLLRKTPQRTIVNYIHWMFVGNMLAYTTESVGDALFELVGNEYGIKERLPRWSECVEDMKMSHAAAYAFVNKYFTEHTESEALKMIKNIQTEMEEEIDRSNWLDKPSKMIVKDKLASMKIFVGFPDWYKDKKKVINSYKGLNIGAEYFDNVLSYMRYAKKRILKRYLIVEEDDDPWAIDPITVNAVYGPQDNTLNIPAADLQSPLFTPSLPDNINYGIAGVIVGHEMGHGFDDTGILFGKNGDETDLSHSILKNYYQRAECFVDQFNEYYGETKSPTVTEPSSVDEIIDSIMSQQGSKAMLTRGENIADTTGLQTVFKAYRKNNKGVSVRLPGLEEFTDDQLFFLSFAAMWCSISTPEYAEKEKEDKDVHSPANIRVLGAVSNTNDFAKVFNCPAGSSMNPINKCNIWEKSDDSTPSKAAKFRRNYNRWNGQWRN